MTARPAFPPPRPPSAGVGVLAALTASAFAAASVVHTGVAVPLGVVTVRDPFPGAVVPEAVIAVVVAVGAGTILARSRASRGIALAACAFAVLGTCYGLAVTVPAGRAGDIAYHVGILALLLLVVGTLLLRRRRPADHARSR